MKLNFIIATITSAILLMGCLSDKKMGDSLPCIDVTKNYPVKEIILTDIATVNYVHLNTKNDDYLYKGFISYMTENTIVVCDNSSGSILFFSKDGIPKSRFNRYGVGPEEYPSNMLISVVYDEVADDVFVSSTRLVNVIQVYSSIGEYKRKLTLPHGTRANPIVDFDKQSLLIFDMQNVFKKFAEVESPFHIIDSSFFLISKMDGKELDYIELQKSEIDLTHVGNTNIGIMFYKRAVKCSDGFLLCNPEKDTVFLYKNDKSVTPIFCKSPLIKDLDQKIILGNFIDTERYQFMVIHTLVALEDSDKFPNIYYFRDKHTGEIFRQKISLPEYKDKTFFITANNYIGNEMLACFQLNLFELKEAYKENKLSGKLKEMVASLNESEDNEVYMFARFK